MTRQQQVIWAAGFIDGEGCITIQKTSAGCKRAEAMWVVVRVAQRKREPLDILASLFGGKVLPDRQYFYWSLASRKAVKAIEEMLPFLILKRDQAEVALALGDEVRRRTYNRILSADDRFFRQFCFEEIRALKK